VTQPFRLASGGLIDRDRTLCFRFNDKSYEGYAGDTLASALLANGTHLVGRSFKYHRPRGIFGVGGEEPNALVQLGVDGRSEPNVRATQQELYDGLVSSSQNCWPSVRFDLGAFANMVSRALPAGFYYKTFMWPPSPRWFARYESIIRRAGGMGRAASVADPDSYEHRFAHCDVLVIGAGPAGLAAALSAMRCGARVILCGDGPTMGGGLVGENVSIQGMHGARWISDALGELSNASQTKVLQRTCAFGYYDQNLIGLVERSEDHLGRADQHAPRQRLWHVRAKAVVLATGAIERSIAYANNDLPGTMLASAARRYVTKYGVKSGSRAVVFTNNDTAYGAAIALRDAGCDVAAIVDSRPIIEDSRVVARAKAAGFHILDSSVLTKGYGRLRVNSVEVVSANGGSPRRLDCDLVCVSGGWNPTVHLFSQSGGKLRFDRQLAAFLPGDTPQNVVVAGAVNGRFGLAAALAEGHVSGTAAAARAGFKVAVSAAPTDNGDEVRISPLWAVPARSRADKRFVDLQNDVTVHDVLLAAREGYRSVEHLKRYTTLGMGTDQGRTSSVLGLAILSDALGVSIPEVGTTTFRPPFAPVALGTLAGQEVGSHLEPIRYSAMHDWHVDNGARFIDAGLWKRPHSYRKASESEESAVDREVLNVRANVGLVDVSTLGKIELQGRDVAEFLNRIYVNRWDSLAVGRCRYGLMLREDGIVFDDGTTSRLSSTHYLMTTTTANAVKVMQYIDFLLQVVWPDLEVYAASVTEQWAAAAVSGPNARKVLAKVVDVDLSNNVFPFLAAGSCNLLWDGSRIPARLFRISFSGELAYEVHVPAHAGAAMWHALMAAGEESSIMPYGVEAMSTLRIEKGHLGAEIDGRATPDDLGLGKLVSAAKWCVGKPLLARPALQAVGRWQLVGLTSPERAFPRGAKIVTDPDRSPPNPMLGHVTSWCWSPHVNAAIALALIADGRSRLGESLWAVSPLTGTRAPVKVVPPCFIDPEGQRLRV
jgi:heterotetrameric sarcosine oxidase alpha subunit